MATTMAFDEVLETRALRETKGAIRWNAYFIQPPEGARLPQAFLVEGEECHLRVTSNI